MFLDFVLASRFKRTYEGLKFFWRFLDIKKQGYLTIFTINYFFRVCATNPCDDSLEAHFVQEVVRKLAELGCDSVNVEDVKDEIFDMVRPADPLHISFEDLVRSNVGHIVIDMLTDAHAFWAYDNREAQLFEAGNEGEA